MRRTGIRVPTTKAGSRGDNDLERDPSRQHSGASNRRTPRQHSQPETPLTWIDVVQTGPKEQPVERMQELPTPPKASTLEPTTVTRSLLRFLQMPIPIFIGELERITTLQKLKSPFKTPGSITVRRFPMNLVTSEGSSGPKARQEPEPSGRGCFSGSGAGGAETSPRTARVVHPSTKSRPSSHLKELLPQSKGGQFYPQPKDLAPRGPKTSWRI